MKSLLNAADAAGCAMAHAEDLLNEGSAEVEKSQTTGEEPTTIDQRHREAQSVRADENEANSEGTDWLRTTIGSLLGGRATA